MGGGKGRGGREGNEREGRVREGETEGVGPTFPTSKNPLNVHGLWVVAMFD